MQVTEVLVDIAQSHHGACHISGGGHQISRLQIRESIDDTPEVCSVQRTVRHQVVTQDFTSNSVFVSGAALRVLWRGEVVAC